MLKIVKFDYFERFKAFAGDALKIDLLNVIFKYIL
jgi:hypothetical protein